MERSEKKKTSVGGKQVLLLLLLLLLLLSLSFSLLSLNMKPVFIQYCTCIVYVNDLVLISIESVFVIVCIKKKMDIFYKLREVEVGGAYVK